MMASMNAPPRRLLTAALVAAVALFAAPAMAERRPRRRLPQKLPR